MLIDSSIMKAFGAKLDWAAERLSNITTPAIYTKNPIRSQTCSVITQNSDTAIPVFVPINNKNVVPAEHEQ